MSVTDDAESKGRRMVVTPSWWHAKRHRTRANIAQLFGALLSLAADLGDESELRVTKHEVVIYGDFSLASEQALRDAGDAVVAFPRAAVQPAPTERAIDAPKLEKVETPVEPPQVAGAPLPGAAPLD